jgi:hypothetical protein
MKKFLCMLPTLLLLLMMVGGGVNYLVNTEFVAAEFVRLGFPVWVLYFNAAAKILGGAVIFYHKSPQWLFNFAFAGYLYILLMAVIAHMVAGDNMYWGALIGLVLWALAFRQHQGMCKK